MMKERTLSLFKRVNGSKIYELLSKIKLVDIKGLIKINNKKLMICDLTGLYEINIQNCKIKKISMDFYRGIDVEFIVKIKDNIYIYQQEILYLLKYLKDDFILVSCDKFDKKDAIKHLLNIINPTIAFNVIIPEEITEMISLKIIEEYMEKLMENLRQESLLITSEEFSEFKIDNDLDNNTSQQIMNPYNELSRVEREREIERRQFLFFRPKKKIYFTNKNRIRNLDKNIKKMKYLNKKHFNNFKKNYR